METELELQVQVVDSLSDALLGFRFRRIQGPGPIHGDFTAEVALEEGKLRLETGGEIADKGPSQEISCCP